MLERFAVNYSFKIVQEMILFLQVNFDNLKDMLSNYIPTSNLSPGFTIFIIYIVDKNIKKIDHMNIIINQVLDSAACTRNARIRQSLQGWFYFLVGYKRQHENDYVATGYNLWNEKVKKLVKIVNLKLMKKSSYSPFSEKERNNSSYIYLQCIDNFIGLVKTKKVLYQRFLCGSCFMENKTIESLHCTKIKYLLPLFVVVLDQLLCICCWW